MDNIPTMNKAVILKTALVLNSLGSTEMALLSVPLFSIMEIIMINRDNSKKPNPMRFIKGI